MFDCCVAATAWLLVVVVVVATAVFSGGESRFLVDVGGLGVLHIAHSVESVASFIKVQAIHAQGVGSLVLVNYTANEHTLLRVRRCWQELEVHGEFLLRFLLVSVLQPR